MIDHECECIVSEKQAPLCREAEWKVFSGKLRNWRIAEAKWHRIFKYHGIDTLNWTFIIMENHPTIQIDTYKILKTHKFSPDLLISSVFVSIDSFELLNSEGMNLWNFYEFFLFLDQTTQHSLLIHKPCVSNTNFWLFIVDFGWCW